MTVTTNLTLSLGMVGALSIVRFRTAVKDPGDTVYMFWSISVGIMAGAGLIYIALITNLALGIIYLLLFFLSKKYKSKPYLLLVEYEAARREEVEDVIRTLKKLRIKSRIVAEGKIELALEASFTPDSIHLVDTLAAMEGVVRASAVSYNGDTTL